MADPKKTTAKAPAKDALPAAKKADTFTDHAVAFAAEARTLADDIRTKVGQLRDDVRDYYSTGSPEPHEAPVHRGMARLMSTVDDLERTLDGVTATAADLDQFAAAAAPPADDED